MSNNQNEEQEKEQTKAKIRIGIFLLVIAVVVGAYVINYMTVGRYNQKTDNAYVNADQNSVTSQVAGLVKEVYVTDTQNVKQGDLLAVIDDTDYKVSLENAGAEIAQAVKSYYSLNAVANASEQSINLKEVVLKKATSDYNRDQKAYKAGLISGEVLANTKGIYDQAKASLNVEVANSQNTKVQLSGSLESYPPLKQAIATYKAAYINLNRTKIYAPISGRVAMKNISIGQKISPNQEILRIIDLSNIWVDGNLKENQLKNLSVGDSVKLESDLNGKEYEGHIIGIAAGTGSSMSLLPAQNATGNWIKVVQRVPVKIAISKESLDKNGELPLGSSMEINIKTKNKNNKNNVEIKVSKTTNLYDINESEIQEQINKIISANRP